MEFRGISPNSIFKEFALENLSLTSVKSEHYNKSVACSKENDSFQETHKRVVLALLASEFTEDSKALYRDDFLSVILPQLRCLSV